MDEQVPLITRQPLPIDANIHVTGIEGGRADVVNAVGILHGNIYSSTTTTKSRLQQLEEDTKHEVDLWTEGTVRVSAVDKVLTKLEDGHSWITITGNPGDGKTTLGHMVLDRLQKQNIRVFRLNTPDDFDEVFRIRDDKALMLDDVFGAFTLDLSSLNVWTRVFQKVFKESEMYQKKNKTYVLFISRKNVLQVAEDHLDCYGDVIFNKKGFVDLSASNQVRDRLNILDWFLKRSSISVEFHVQLSISALNMLHGFPHCCKLYTELVKDGTNLDIQTFFNSPLQFLDNTTRLYVRNGCMNLFKQMLINDGELSVASISDDNERTELCFAAKELSGSYVEKEMGKIVFTHPSIYESVILVIGELDEFFIIKHASLSVVLQKVNIRDGCHVPGYVNVDPVPEVIDVLCERTGELLLNKDFSIFAHRFCDNSDFCRRLIHRVFKENAKRLPINEKDSTGRTVLHVASEGGKATAIRVLLENGADVKIKDEERKTVLHYLCQGGRADISTLQLLIDKGVDVKGVDSSGRTALHFLCSSQAACVSTIELLVQHHVNVNAVDRKGFTALLYLLFRDNLDKDAVDFLIRNGSDVNKCDKEGRAALHHLCLYAKANAIELLIKYGAGINKPDNRGDTPLHLLVTDGKVDVKIIYLLIKNGADVNKANKNGKSPLQRLCQSHGMTESIELLLEHGSDASHTDIEGKTALHYYSDKRSHHLLFGSGKANVNVLKLLINHGADVNAADQEGMTALHYLYKSRRVNDTTEELLFRHGADVNKTDKLGRSPQYYKRNPDFALCPCCDCLN